MKKILIISSLVIFLGGFTASSYAVLSQHSTSIVIADDETTAQPQADAQSGEATAEPDKESAEAKTAGCEKKGETADKSSCDKKQKKEVSENVEQE